MRVRAKILSCLNLYFLQKWQWKWGKVTKETPDGESWASRDPCEEDRTKVWPWTRVSSLLSDTGDSGNSLNWGMPYRSQKLFGFILILSLTYFRNTDWPFRPFLLIELGLVGGTLEGHLDTGGNLHFTDMQIEGFGFVTSLWDTECRWPLGIHFWSPYSRGFCVSVSAFLVQWVPTFPCFYSVAINQMSWFMSFSNLDRCFHS